MNVTPIRWSTFVLLLQPWSTATVQTKNNPIAITARIFSTMTTPYDSPIFLPNDLIFRSDTNHANRNGISAHNSDEGNCRGWSSLLRSYPAHCRTGRRGYFGNVASVK